MVIDLTPKASLEEVMGLYLEQFRNLLDCPRKDRDRLTALAANALDNIACESSDLTYADFVENLDTPSHFAQALQDELDQNSLRRYRRRKKLCFIGGIAAVIALWISISAALSLYWHGQYVESQRLNDRMALVIFPARTITEEEFNEIWENRWKTNSSWSTATEKREWRITP